MFMPMKEMDIYGVFIPPLLMWGTIALVTVKLGHAYLSRREFYRSDVEAQVFDMALFIVLISLLSFLVR